MSGEGFWVGPELAGHQPLGVSSNLEQVPSRLRGKQLYSLDLGQLVVRGPDEIFPRGAGVDAFILLMEEILHHLGCIEPYK